VREIREEERNPEMIRVALSRITKPLLTETPSTGNLRLRGQVIQSFFRAKSREAEVNASKSHRGDSRKDIHLMRLHSPRSVLGVGAAPHLRPTVWKMVCGPGRIAVQAC